MLLGNGRCSACPSGKKAEENPDLCFNIKSPAPLGRGTVRFADSDTLFGELLPYAWDISIADSESPLTNPNLGKKGRQDSLR